MSHQKEMRGELKRLANWSARAAWVVWSILLLGCDPKPVANETVKPDQKLSQSPDTPLLTGAGAKLTADGGGAVITVDLRGIELTDAIAKEIQQLKTVQNLLADRLALTPEGWSALAALSELRQLDFRDCKITGSEFQPLVAGLKKLRAVRLSGKSGATDLDDAAIAALAGATDLRVLAVDHLWISEQALQPLSGCKQLSELYLAATLVDDAAMTTVAQFKNLKKLRLAQTSVGTEGLNTLVGLPLEDLDLSECSQITDDSLEAVGKLEALKRLNLWRDPIGDQGVARLAGLKRMEWLNVDNTQLSDAGLETIAQMTELTFLHLGSTAVTDGGMPKLTALKKLKDLKVTRTAVTESGVEGLKRELPQLDVQLKYLEQEP